MLSRVFLSAADSITWRSPISVQSHWPCMRTATNVRSPSPGQSPRWAGSEPAAAAAAVGEAGLGLGAAASLLCASIWWFQQL